MQLESVMRLTEDILKQARKKLSRQIDDRYATLDAKEFDKGCVILCPFCKYDSQKHPKGSAIIRGNLFKCFSCGERRRVE